MLGNCLYLGWTAVITFFIDTFLSYCGIDCLWVWKFEPDEMANEDFFSISVTKLKIFWVLYDYLLFCQLLAVVELFISEDWVKKCISVFRKRSLFLYFGVTVIKDEVEF